MYACVRFADILRYDLIDKIPFRFIYNMRTTLSELLMSDSFDESVLVGLSLTVNLSYLAENYAFPPHLVLLLLRLLHLLAYTNFPLELLAIYKIVHLPRVPLFLLHCRKCCNADGRSNVF